MASTFDTAITEACRALLRDMVETIYSTRENDEWKKYMEMFSELQNSPNLDPTETPVFKIIVKYLPHMIEDSMVGAVYRMNFFKNHYEAAKMLYSTIGATRAVEKASSPK